MPRLCALGCKSSETITHRFPNPDKFPEQFESWVTLVCGKLEKPSDYENYRKRVICDKHFTDADKNRNRRLNRLAVPTLHLPPGKLDCLQTSQANISEETCFSNLEQILNQLPPQPALPPANMDVTRDTAARTRTSLTMEHNYGVISKSKWTGGIYGGQDGLKTKSACTSLQEKISLRTKIKRLRTEISKLRKRGNSATGKCRRLGN